MEIDAEAAVRLQVQVTPRPARLAGTFSDVSGRPVSDYLVVAFPDERTLWRWPSRRIQGVRPASNGEFSFTGLPPGAYRLAAVVDATDDNLHDPDFLESLHAAGVPVTVRAGERVVQDIRVGGD